MAEGDPKPDPLETLLRQIMADADAADEACFQASVDAAEKLCTAFNEGWEKGLPGLLANPKALG